MFAVACVLIVSKGEAFHISLESKVLLSAVIHLQSVIFSRLLILFWLLALPACHSLLFAHHYMLQASPGVLKLFSAQNSGSISAPCFLGSNDFLEGLVFFFFFFR